VRATCPLLFDLPHIFEELRVSHYFQFSLFSLLSSIPRMRRLCAVLLVLVRVLVTRADEGSCTSATGGKARPVWLHRPCYPQVETANVDGVKGMCVLGSSTDASMVVRYDGAHARDCSKSALNGRD